MAPVQVLDVLDEAQPRAALDPATAADLASQQGITAADSDLALVESTFNRYQTLYEKKSVSPQEFDEVKDRYQAAEGTPRHGPRRADAGEGGPSTGTHRSWYTRILAPFDGLVTEKKSDVGALVSLGMPTFTVEDLHRYRTRSHRQRD